MRWEQIAVIALLVAGPLRAGDFVREVEQPLSRAYVPNGYDSNDSVQIVLEGNFETACHQIGRTDSMVNAEDRSIELFVTAYEYTGDCPKVPTPFHLTFFLGRVSSSGEYSLVDMATKRKIGSLSIAPAPTGGPGTDSVTYAPVTDAFLWKRDSGTSLILRGVFSQKCSRIKTEIRVKDDVVLVLPVLEVGFGRLCTAGEFPFEQEIPIRVSLPEAKYLLHVRSRGGQSINKIVQGNR